MNMRPRRATTTCGSAHLWPDRCLCILTSVVEHLHWPVQAPRAQFKASTIAWSHRRMLTKCDFNGSPMVSALPVSAAIVSTRPFDCPPCRSILSLYGGIAECSAWECVPGSSLTASSSITRRTREETTAGSLFARSIRWPACTPSSLPTQSQGGRIALDLSTQRGGACAFMTPSTSSQCRCRVACAGHMPIWSTTQPA